MSPLDTPEPGDSLLPAPSGWPWPPGAASPPVHHDEPVNAARAPETAPRGRPLRVTVLAGGVGGARFLTGLREVAAAPPRPTDITAIVNTADDITMHGLRITPDLDSVMYTLSGVADTDRGWGRRDESDVVSSELAAFGEPSWFTLGDRDIAVHVLRTAARATGATASQVVERLCQRFTTGVRLLPMSDDDVETWVELDTGETVHFQEWWVRLRAQVPARAFHLRGIDACAPAPGVLDAITGADAVLLAPSNPVVSIGPVLAVPGVRAALAATRAPVVGVSPIIGGRPVHGMAHACLSALGVPTTASAVGGLYADVLDAWLVDAAADGGLDGTTVPGGHGRVVAAPLLMARDGAAAVAGAALDAALGAASTPSRAGQGAGHGAGQRPAGRPR